MTKRIALAPPSLVVALVLLEAELISGPVHSGLLQAVIALPLALYLPGAALRRALSRQPGDGLADQILISVGLSLVVLVVGGVVLDLFAVGLRPITWLAYILLAMLVAELITLARGERAATYRTIRVPRLRPRRLASGMAIIGLVAAAFAISIVGAHRQRFPGFAQFWLIPHGSGVTYELGVTSHTGHLDTYDVNLAVGGHSVGGWHIRLSSGQSWSAVVRLPANASVSATLFRNGAAGVYRQVSIRNTSA